MIETAVAFFGLDLAGAWRLTMAEYRLLEGAHHRRLKAEHERDLWLAWMTASMIHRPIPYEKLLPPEEAARRRAKRRAKARAFTVENKKMMEAIKKELKDRSPDG